MLNITTGIEHVSLCPRLLEMDPAAARVLRCAGWLLIMSLRRQIPLGVHLTLYTCKLLLGACLSGEHVHLHGILEGVLPSFEDLHEISPQLYGALQAYVPGGVSLFSAHTSPPATCACLLMGVLFRPTCPLAS